MMVRGVLMLIVGGEYGKRYHRMHPNKFSRDAQRSAGLAPLSLRESSGEGPGVRRATRRWARKGALTPTLSRREREVDYLLPLP